MWAWERCISFCIANPKTHEEQQDESKEKRNKEAIERNTNNSLSYDANQRCRVKRWIKMYRELCRAQQDGK